MAMAARQNMNPAIKRFSKNSSDRKVTLCSFSFFGFISSMLNSWKQEEIISDHLIYAKVNYPIKNDDPKGMDKKGEIEAKVRIVAGQDVPTACNCNYSAYCNDLLRLSELDWRDEKRRVMLKAKEKPIEWMGDIANGKPSIWEKMLNALPKKER
ncbi:MAG: hypothetical protein SP4CHLAM5_03760 [Chlamydiia bacterium]|nr:hypothetical protein [Chlamydiia bacterium]MCH9618250.1 hypothetical protein [Chlamydiia bacterium]